MVIVRRAVHRSPERVQEEMERVFRALMPDRPRVVANPAGLWRPPVEVYETPDNLAVTVEVAGMDEQALNVVVENDVLSIRGNRPDTRNGSRRVYREAGIAYGEFGVDVYLPFPVDTEAASAAYDNGLLRIMLPRVAARSIVPRLSKNSDGGEGRSVQ